MLAKFTRWLRLKPHAHQWQPLEREFLEVCGLCGVTRWVLSLREYEGYHDEEDSHSGGRSSG